MDNFFEIDFDFIDQIYFSSSEEKETFIKYLEDTLTHLNINKEKSRSDVLRIMVNSQRIFPFISELLVFDSDYIRGKNKLTNYYTALKLCKHNLENKINHNNVDFKFEEELLSSTLNFNLFNYARIDTIFYFALVNN